MLMLERLELCEEEEGVGALSLRNGLLPVRTHDIVVLGFRTVRGRATDDRIEHY